jgi:hypothetical protein
MVIQLQLMMTHGGNPHSTSSSSSQSRVSSVQPLQLQMIQRHLQAEVDSSAVPPCQLPDHAAQQLAASLPAGLLPGNWQSYPSWQQLDRALIFTGHGTSSASEMKSHYKEAKMEVQRLCAAEQQAAGQLQPQQQQHRAQIGGSASAWGVTGSAFEPQDSRAMAEASKPSWAAAAAAAAPGPAAPATAPEVQAPAAATSGLAPGSAAWDAALQKLLSRGGFAGKEAGVMWRIIMPDGDRLGPFSSADMQAWLLHGRPPRGVTKHQVGAVVDDPASLALCGILSCDYSA